MSIDNEINILLPNFKGTLDSRVDREITTSIIKIVDYFNQKLAKQKQEFNDIITKLTNEFKTAQEDVTGLIKIFSTGVVGSDTSDPLIESLTQQFGQQGAFLVFAVGSIAAAPSFQLLASGHIPNLDAAKITIGVFSLGRLPTNILKTDVNLAENVSGAPNVNTGKTLIKDNSGHSVNVMTCA